jgi:hypothetical protein
VRHLLFFALTFANLAFAHFLQLLPSAIPKIYAKCIFSTYSKLKQPVYLLLPFCLGCLFWFLLLAAFILDKLEIILIVLA